MAYFVRHTQSGEESCGFSFANDALENAEVMGWEDCEVILMETYTPHPLRGILHREAEFQCTYSWRYGEDFYRCQLASNRPDGYCEVHSA